MKTSSFFAILILGLILSTSCKEHKFQWTYKDAQAAAQKQTETEAPTVLKAHLKNGSVYFFPGEWTVDTNVAAVSGYAYVYDYNRDLLKNEELLLPIDSVVFFEVNKELALNSGHAMLLPLTLVNTTISLVCLVNPKACFGSCPTFYTNEDQGLFSARAEGFSNAIMPSLEYADIDDLQIPSHQGPSFDLVMKNEAQETHVLRSIKLYAFKAKNDEQIYQSRAGKFFAGKGLYKPINASLFKEADQEEYYSEADSEDLATKEELVLDFEGIPEGQDIGLVLDFRQSLMTTYFIYNAISYMGDAYSEILSDLERKGNFYETMDGGFKNELGELEVLLWNEENSSWELQGAFYETGPIAVNRQLLKLTDVSNRNLKLKLRMNKGLWRIDRANLTVIKGQLEPQIIEPNNIDYNGQKSPSHLKQLNSPESPMLSMPGDQFLLSFSLPSAEPYALFLSAQGYYLEWMRDEWLGDKDARKLRRMFYQPSRYLKDEAEAFKIYEQTMESVFWSSQVPPKPISSKK